MAENRKITTTELDFDGIKSSLKSYLQGQSKFSDYDFEGSGLSILLDVLAYNTHYNALYHNLAVNESFLDSAVKRSSVVSKAKELGYVPTSAKCAQAVLKVVMVDGDNDAAGQISFAKYTPFTTSIDGTNYTFYATSSYTASDVDNTYTFEDVEVKQGTLLSNTFEYNGTVNSFVIPNPGIDTSTLVVTVNQSAGSAVSSVYTASSTVLSAGGDDPVYFLKELDDNYYEIEFGNGVVGKSLDSGNEIVVQYIVPDGSVANGARTFTYSGSAPLGISSSDIYVVTTTPAFNGAEPEDVESIKFNAPRQYTAQNRCVTIEDYKTVIKSLYPTAESLHVWGGEDVTPPEYGKVFISVKPQDADTLTTEEKEYILDTILSPRKMINIEPVFVDPDYLYVEIDATFYYNKNETTLSATDLKTLVRQTIIDYNDDNLSVFGGILKYSALLRAIDNAEASITNSIITHKLRKIVTPIYNESSKYIIDIANPIYNSGVPEYSVFSGGVNIAGYNKTSYIEDVPVSGSDYGTLRAIYFDNNGNKNVLKEGLGTVYYSKGVLELTDFLITGVAGTNFEFIFKPQSNDVASTNNQIVLIEDSLIKVTAKEDKPSNSYIFTSSRN